MAKVFVAAEEETSADVRRILGTAHQVVSAADMVSAVAQLEEVSFDLILIGVMFDESRMYDLLPLTKTERNRNTPVICFATVDTPITRIMSESIEMTCAVFGVWMYLDRQKFAEAQSPDDEMARLIERCLTHEARKTALAERIDIQASRENIMQHRVALEEEEWSPELEDKLGKIRQKLSKLMLELSELRIDHVEQKEQIAVSTALNDPVPETVSTSEVQLERKENVQEMSEFKQTREENQIVESEEIRSKEGRRQQALGTEEKLIGRDL